MSGRTRPLCRLAAVLLVCGIVGHAQATPVSMTVGAFDLTFYNNGDSDGTSTGAQNWTPQQMDDVAASVGVWTGRLTNTPGRQVQFHLFWNNFSGSILGDSGGSSNGNGTTSWTYVEHVWRDGVNYTGPWTGFDCRIRFDTDAAGYSWNFGTGNPASSQIDFRSVVTHEIGHSVGFVDTYYPSPYDKWGFCWGTASNPFEFAGYLGISNWDQNLMDDAGNRPANNKKGTPGNFNQTDNPVWFTGANAVAYYGGNVPVFAPSTYQAGSSLSHLDETLLPNALMSPSISLGQMVRQPLRLEWEIMEDLGWSVLITKTWTKGGGTLSWANVANWSPNGAPDATWDVLLDGTGLADGDVLDIGGNQSVNLLSIDSTAAFTIGGASGILTIVKGNLVRSAASSGVQTIARPVTLGTSAIWDIAGSGRLAVSGAISGSGSGLEKRGQGTLLLSGANTYSGITVVRAGTLLVGANAPSGSPGALGSATSSVLLGDTSGAADASLLISGPYTVSRGVTVQSGSAGNITLGGTNTSGTATFAGSVSLAKSAALTAAAGGTVAFTGTVSGAGGVTKTGDGILTLSGTNTYTGATTISAGTLSVGADANLGNANPLVFDGGTLQVTGTTLTSFGSHTPTFNATKTVGLDINNAANTFTVSQTMNQTTGGVTKTGDGTLTLTGNNTYEGLTTVSAGTLTLGRAGGTIKDSSPVTVSGGTLNVANGDTVGAVTLSSGTISGAAILTGSSYSLTNTGLVSAVLAGSGVTLTKTGAGTATLTAANTYDGLTTVSEGTLVLGGAGGTIRDTAPVTVSGGTLDVANADTVGAVTLSSGTISGASALTGSSYSLTNTGLVSAVLAGSGVTLTKTGAGTATLTAANLYTGATLISTGTLQIGNGSTSGSLATASAITTNATLAFNRSNTITQGTDFAGTIGGTGGVTKAGSGTLTLTGANTYSGGTTASTGTLLVNNTSGSGTGSGTVTVASGTTLGGTGTLGGTTTISGHHTPGTSAGIQTFGSNLTYNTGADVTWELTANTATQGTLAVFDQIVVDLSLDFAGTTALILKFNVGSTVDWTNAFWNTNWTWLLYDAGSTSNISNLALTVENWLDSNGVAFNTAHPDKYFYRSTDGEDVMLNYLLAGDANLDRAIDFLDGVVVSNNYGTGSTWTEGDVSGDGMVNFLDFVVISNNYGSHTPEPATLALLGLGGLALILRRGLERGAWRVGRTGQAGKASGRSSL